MLSSSKDKDEKVFKKGHRAKPSFGFFAMEDNYKNLEEIAKEFARESDKVKSKRYFFKKYKKCFKGSQLVDWLSLKGYASTRAGALALGQRMLDSRVLVHITLEHDFEDTPHLFYTLEDRNLKHGPSVTDVVLKAGKSNISSSFLLLKGVHYNRLYVVLTNVKGKVPSLYVFRNKQSSHPLSLLRLKGVECTVYECAPELDSGSNLSLSSSSSASSLGHARSKSNEEEREREREKKRFISYLKLEAGRGHRCFVFRIERASTLQYWTSALLAAGLSVKTEVVRRDDSSRSFSKTPSS